LDWDSEEGRCDLLGIFCDKELEYMKWLAISLCAVPLICNALPVGDTQGTVKAIRSLPAANGEAFEVYFSSVTNDRWGCIQSSGKIVVSQSATSVSTESFKRMFAIALAAQASGKQLALDSEGSAPCGRVTIAWMVD
jgi:hypothetical protein